MRTPIRISLVPAALLVSLAFASLAGAEEPAAGVVRAAPGVIVTVTQAAQAAEEKDEDLEILSLSAADSYKQAVVSYEKAMGLVAGTDRSQELTDAIRLVNHTLDLTPGDTDAMILAAQCYRARGGKAYADKYDTMAETALKETIMDSDFRNLGAMLDYAILCYAEGSADKVKTAENQARYIIQSVEGSPVLMKTPAARRAEGLACLIIGRQDLTKALLAESDPDFSKFFTDTVDQGKWLWLVKTDLTSREFLLWFIRHTEGRYEGLTPPAPAAAPAQAAVSSAPQAPAASTVPPAAASVTG